MTTNVSASTIMQRCTLLGGYSEDTGRLTRPFASQAMKQVNEVVASWMRSAGMTVRTDKVGNLIGRYEAQQADAKTLLFGSHLDSIRDAGKYDGPLGVMVALASIERLHARGERLPFAIEVIGFADEEGLRYNYAYIGSKAATGTFDLEALDFTDAHGITMSEAIRAFGGNPDRDLLHTANWQAADLLGYCEVHIEQGPVLEAHDLSVGVVSAISGHTRCMLTFEGFAGHAGTVPMGQRQDALCAAAEFVLAVEAQARSRPGAVATVGQVRVQPGATNVIPGVVKLSLDVRHPEDAVREDLSAQLQSSAKRICADRNISLRWQPVQTSRSVPCDPHLTHLFEQAIEKAGYPLLSLPSGAGHDGVPMSSLTGVAMLFVRCAGGISHHPVEAVNEADVAVAIEVLENFLHLLKTDAKPRGASKQ
jgi:allantoate deiminase